MVSTASAHPPLFPTLAGMNSAVIYKQLDDFRSGKRLWGVMNAMASALSEQDSADVAAYFAHRPEGLPPVAGEGVPESGRSLRQRDPGIRLVFAGDPERGIPPCAACHGPGAQKLGAPPLRGQHAEYIERQLAAFAQGMRQNDINEQMRVIAHELTPDEMHALAAYYGARTPKLYARQFMRHGARPHQRSRSDCRRASLAESVMRKFGARVLLPMLDHSAHG